MFEELGFKPYDYEDENIIAYSNWTHTEIINFWLDGKYINTQLMPYDKFFELLDAITQQCKELGWLESEE